MSTNMTRVALFAAALAVLLTGSACGGGNKFIHKSFLQPDIGGRATPDLSALGTITALVESNGRFYVAGQTGVAAVNPDGSVAWLKPQPAALMRYVAAAEGKVATSSFDSATIKDLSYFLTGKRDFTTADHAAVALLADTGEELWTAKLTNPDWLSAPDHPHRERRGAERLGLPHLQPRERQRRDDGAAAAHRRGARQIPTARWAHEARALR